MRLVYKFNIGQNEEISKLCKISNNLYNQAFWISIVWIISNFTILIMRLIK